MTVTLCFGYFTQRTLATTVEMPVASSANRTRNSDVAVIADRTAYTTYGILTNIKPISVTSWRTAGTHDSIQRVEFMNAPKLNLLKRDWRSRSQWITGRNATMARLIVCLKNSRSRFLPLFRCVLWLNDTSYSKSVTLHERTNRNLPARNMLVQLLALYTDPDNHTVQRSR